MTRKSFDSAVCALTGAEFPRTQLVRLVYNEAYGWCVDAKGDLPGESCWIMPSSVEIQHNAERLLSVAPEVLLSLLDRYLFGRVQQTLSRVRRAGAYCIGGDRIQQWLVQNPGQASGVFFCKLTMAVRQSFGRHCKDRGENLMTHL